MDNVRLSVTSHVVQAGHPAPSPPAPRLNKAVIPPPLHRARELDIKCVALPLQCGTTVNNKAVIAGLTLPLLPDAEVVSLSGPAGDLGGYFWRHSGHAPAALLLHGWGQDAGAMVQPARLFHAAGWHALSLSQRGWRGSAGCDDYGRSAPEDLPCALAWLAAQPEVHRPLVLLGFSMGGLSALLSVSLPGVEPSHVSHVVAVNPPTDLRATYDRTTIRALKRCYDATLTPEQWREGSPLTHAARLRLPALLVIGMQDRICPPELGEQYAAAAGARLVTVADLAHQPDAAQWAVVAGEVMAWALPPEHDVSTPSASSSAC